MPNSPEKTNENKILVSLSIQIVKVNGKTAVQLKKVIKDKALIKWMIDQALKDKEIPAKIVFKDSFYAASRLKAANLI